MWGSSAQSRGVGEFCSGPICAGLMALSAARTAQLEADQVRTRAISAYLKDRRGYFESLVPRDLKNNAKRMELLRTARRAFREEPQSVQTRFIQEARGSRAAVGAGVQAAVQEAAEPEASMPATVKRRKLVGKQNDPSSSGPLSSDSLSSQVATGQQVEQEPKTPLRRTAAVEKTSLEMTTLRMGAASPGPAMSPRNGVGVSGRVTEGVGVNVTGRAGNSANPENQSVGKLGSASPRAVVSVAGASPRALVSVAGSMLAAASARQPGPPGPLMRSLPACLPRLTRVVDPADAADILASATRILQKCPGVLGDRGVLGETRLNLKQAVLFGAAAKLKANADTINIPRLWLQFVRGDFSTRLQIMALEVRLVQAMGHA